MTAPAKDDDVREMIALSDALDLESVEFVVYCVLREKMFSDIYIANSLSKHIADVLLSQFEIHKRPEVISR